MFRNDQEYRYFKVFSTQTASQLTGLFAYHEYSKAIIEMRKTIAEKALDLRTRLIASLVFICFEVHHCNKVSAVAQIETMSSLLEAQVKSQDMCRQSIATIDDEILESFRELEIQDLIQNCYAKGYGKDLTPRQLAASRQTIQTMMPLQFISLRQARSEFHVLNMRQLYWQGFAKYEWPWYATQETLAIMNTQRVNGPPHNESGWSISRRLSVSAYEIFRISVISRSVEIIK